MYHKKIADASFQTAVDNTILTEIIHPKHNANDPNISYSLAFAKILPGNKSKAHKLTYSTEVLIFTKGYGKMIIENETELISKGSIILVPPQKLQYVINTGETDLEFYCIVSPPWKKEEDISL